MHRAVTWRGRREVAVDAHHLAGRTHLGTEDGVDDLALVRAETLERQDRGLDGDRSAVVNLARVVCGQRPCSRKDAIESPTWMRAAALASCTPVAFEAKGTVREARGFASMT